jgi:phosphoribosylanthranilate isomerase
MSFAVKICGLTEPERLDDAVRWGADYVGFIFYPPSGRCLRPDLAHDLAARVPPGVEKVGVFVDPSDAELEAVLAHVPLDIIQLHGSEPAERIEAVGLSTGCRVMKALRVEEADDLATLDEYAAIADLLLFDAKPPRRPDAIPGGNGLAFDWQLLAGLALTKPWALAGGITADNLAVAIDALRPTIVDVSSGVESRPGIKDPQKLRAFFDEVTRLRARSVAQEPLGA